MQKTIEGFPEPIKQVVKKSFTTETMNEKAKFIMLGIKENCPNLYNYIKSVKS